jgi:ABC-type amino acid transport substrate-binding protein
MATQSGLTFEYIDCKTLPELIEATERGDVDVAALNMTITSERLKQLEFTYPFMNGGLQVMVAEDHKLTWGHFFRSFQKSGGVDVFLVCAAFVVVLSVVGTLLQRRIVKDFTPHWHEGLAETFYHVMRLVMQGRTSFRRPPSATTNVVAGLWLIVGVATVAYITSTVTSILTAHRLTGAIRSFDDLRDKQVGVETGSVAAEYCARKGLWTREYPSADVAVQDLLDHRIAGIVADSAILRYYDKSHPELPITEVGPLILDEQVAFALPKDSPLLGRLNVALFDLRESGFVRDLSARYFGE